MSEIFSKFDSRTLLRLVAEYVIQCESITNTVTFFTCVNFTELLCLSFNADIGSNKK